MLEYKLTKLLLMGLCLAMITACSPTPEQPPTPPPTPAPTVQPAASPTALPTVAPAPTATIAAAPKKNSTVSLLGVWIDKAQPETVQVELTESGEMLFRMRTKSTIQGQAPTYGEWNTVATLIWKQAGPDSIELTSGDKRETWKVDWSRPALLQPKSDGSGTIEFVRP